MTQSRNQVSTKRVLTDAVTFTDKPTAGQIQHLKRCGFRYDKGQWGRSETLGGAHEAAAALTYQPLELAGGDRSRPDGFVLTGVPYRVHCRS